MLQLLSSRRDAVVGVGDEVLERPRPRPGSSETLTIRMSGVRFHPSARMVPVESRPSAAAVSRLER